MLRRTCLHLLAGGAVGAMAFRSRAATPRTLVLGIATAPTSLDPHYHDAYTSTQALLQIYSQLRVQDHTAAVGPGLAETCVALDDTNWELGLRPGVRFHDGTPFEAEDIGFSFERARTLSPALGSFAADVRDVAAIEIVSPTKVRIRLNGPDPLFEYKLGQVCMLSRKIHAQASTADFTSGRLAIGTGAYKLVRYAIGERMELEANPDFWGGKPDWDRVSIRYIADAGARMAALRSGDVDLVDGVAVQDIAGLKAQPDFAIFSSPSFLTIYLSPDTAREQTPFVTDNAGQPLLHNPLADPRVRRALSLAINREAVVEQLMLGQGRVPDQFVGLAAADRAPDMPSLRTDPAKAKRLLAEAGYPDGFQITIHSAAGYFTNDVAVTQAIGQFFARIGVRTKVETLPVAMFAAQAAARAFSLYMSAFNGAFALIALRYVAMVPNAATGDGASNRLHYDNPLIQSDMTTALRTMDPVARRALTTDATRVLIDDMGAIPVFNGVNNWAGRAARLRYQANPMGRTSAFMAKPVG